MKHLLIVLVFCVGSVLAADELPRASPESQGISSKAVLAFVEAADQVDAMNSFVLLRHGHVVAEGWWSPYASDDPHMLYSLSKSFTSTAVGLAVAEGKLSIDDSVLSFFPDDAPEQASEHLKSMRVRDLLAMSTGHHNDEVRSFSFDSEERLTKVFLALPVAHKPGTHFVYNTPATYMCSAIVQKVTGEKVLDYLRPRLFEPLGIKNPTWSESAQGVNHGGFGLNVTTEDIARFGQLYLQKGKWNGRRLLPAEWAEAATSRQTSNGSNPNSDWEQGYGYQFWRCRHDCYRGDGAFGQYCIVMPRQDSVLAITSGVRNMQAVLELVWEHLLPAMQSAPLPADDANCARLMAKLPGLQMSTPRGNATVPTASEVTGKTYRLSDNEKNIESITFDFGPEETRLVVEDAAGAREIRCGNGTWLKQRTDSLGGLGGQFADGLEVGIAASGAWTSGNTYTAKLCLFETPYYLKMSFQFDGSELVCDSEYNVAFGSTKQARLIGKIEQQATREGSGK